MSIAIPGRVVVFDYGEVISRTPSEDDRRAVTDAAGVPAGDERFWSAYWRSRNALDQGAIAIPEYWRGIAAELGRSWSAARLHRLWLADYRSWLSVDDGTLDILVELEEGGTRLALLSNAGRDFGSYFRHGSLGGLFEEVFVSGELGLVKPGPEIFEAVLAQLGITAEELVFIDNKAENVRGAEALGATGHVFTGAPALRAFLEGLAADAA
jgi:putative hydrolase of the HAD superfamily